EILEENFDFRADPEQAILQAGEFVHSDYAYELEAAWDIWAPKKEGELDETTYKEDGHVQVDFGLDTPFLYEEGEFTPKVAARIKSNVQKLVNFVHAVEKNCGISGRVLWS